MQKGWSSPRGARSGTAPGNRGTGPPTLSISAFQGPGTAPCAGPETDQFWFPPSERVECSWLRVEWSSAWQRGERFARSGEAREENSALNFFLLRGLRSVARLFSPGAGEENCTVSAPFPRRGRFQDGFVWQKCSFTPFRNLHGQPAGIASPRCTTHQRPA